jgi:hypothetical protein
MTLKVVDVVGGSLLDEVWDLYYAAFRELNEMTVQRHLMYRPEFDAVMADPRIDKYLALDDAGRVAGLSVYTNQLAAWPLISPAYFRRRWPVHYAEYRIWYCGFVAVPGHQPGIFTTLVEAMYRHAEQHQGVISLDICQLNIDAHRLDKVIATWLTRISNRKVRVDRGDVQTFRIYETCPDGAA